MEIQFDNETGKGVRPASRVYAPTKRRKDDGFEPEESAGGVKKAPVFQDDKPKLIRPVHEVKPLTRFAIIVCAFIFAGMVLFILTGYEQISRAYAGVNTLNDDIEQTQLSINALEAAIECAVTIDQAQTTAEEYGMQYPSADQYVESGSAIPVTGSPAGEGTGTEGEGTGDEGMGEGDATDGAADPTTPDTAADVPQGDG